MKDLVLTLLHLRIAVAIGLGLGAFFGFPGARTREGSHPRCR